MIRLQVAVLLGIWICAADGASVPPTEPPPPPPTTNPPPTTTPAFCEWEGQQYPADQGFNPSPCVSCHCPPEGGEPQCAMPTCMPPACVDSSTQAGQCCATCPNGPNCNAQGQVISTGQDVLVNGMLCRCPDPDSGNFNLDAECMPLTTPPFTTPPYPVCEWGGQEYPGGQDFYPSECHICHCPQEGGEPMCFWPSCMPPPCVDSTKQADQCCATCPNGPNCDAQGQVIPAGQDVVTMYGMLCRCRDPNSWNFSLEAECTPLPTTPPPTTNLTTTPPPPTTWNPTPAPTSRP